MTTCQQCLRFFTGLGQAPTYVSHFFLDSDSASITLRFADSEFRNYTCLSAAEVEAKIAILLKHKVPFSVDGFVVDSAERLQDLLATGKLMPVDRYVQISWSNPYCWELREMKKGGTCWQAASTKSEITELGFFQVGGLNRLRRLGYSARPCLTLLHVRLGRKQALRAGLNRNGRAGRPFLYLQFFSL